MENISKTYIVLKQGIICDWILINNISKLSCNTILFSYYIYPNYVFTCLWNWKIIIPKGTYSPFISPASANLLRSFPMKTPSTSFSFCPLNTESLLDSPGQLSRSFPFLTFKKGFSLLESQRENNFIKVLSPQMARAKPENSITYSSKILKRGYQSHNLPYLSLTGLEMGHDKQHLNIVTNWHF